MGVLGRGTAIRIGAFGPLSRPGIPGAGAELFRGMELAVEQVNARGELAAPLELRFEDTAGLAARGTAVVERLLRDGVDALAGEFHSVVADAIVEDIDRAGTPFVCASATIDTITQRRLPCVFRLAPPQSYGWASYADFLVSEGFRHVVTLVDDRSPYWLGGAAIVEDRLRPAAVHTTRVATAGRGAPDVAAAIAGLADPAPDMILLLVGHPEPLGSLLVELRQHALVRPAVHLGDPAGRVAFSDWWEVAQEDAVDMPCLVYARLDHLSPGGQELRQRYRGRHGHEPTFVALEGADAIFAVAEAFRHADPRRARDVCDALRHVTVRGTREDFRFTTEPSGSVHQQWRWPPVYVAACRRRGATLAEAELLWDTRAGAAIGRLRA
jgi:ABC-type branched-subunit amino acid transport system substrate-binding protein